MVPTVDLANNHPRGGELLEAAARQDTAQQLGRGSAGQDDPRAIVAVCDRW